MLLQHKLLVADAGRLCDNASVQVDIPEFAQHGGGAMSATIEKVWTPAWRQHSPRQLDLEGGTSGCSVSQTHTSHLSAS